MTHKARIADPTNEARGWHRYRKPTRNLKAFRSGRTIRSGRVAIVTPASTPTLSRKDKPWRATYTSLSSLLFVAARVGLNEQNVATLYRERRDYLGRNVEVAQGGDTWAIKS